MELVRGIRITDYCDQANLSAKERLDLFIKVCQAIQHAHQKGIIHRDIKPSNILVTLHDGVPVPKVIDFGIAKATEGRLTDATVYTQLHQFIGTPAYMSPEQAEMSGLDIDTRSDIYSLGVLLYELLAGSTPFDPKELMAAGIDAMRKTIREQEPMRPSTRFATLKGEELTTAAKHRSSDAPKLIHLLKGDLDWIVMKCLEKDRTRRYETANGLAADLKRYLDNEPVVARPPSRLYRFGKTVRRNKLAFAAAAAVIASLAAGMGLSTWLFFREREAHRRQVAAVQGKLRAHQQAEEQRKRAEQEQRLRQLGGLRQEAEAQGKWAEAERLAAERLALQKQLLGAENADVAEMLVELGAAQAAQRQWTNAEITLRAGLSMERKYLPKGDAKLVVPVMLLGAILEKQDRAAEFKKLERTETADLPPPNDLQVAMQAARAVAVLKAAGIFPSLGESQPSDTNSVPYLARQANVLVGRGQYAEAEQIFGNHLTPDFLKRPECAPLLSARADFLARRSRWKEAAADYSRLVEFTPSDHWLHFMYAPLLVQNGDLEGYRRHCAQVLALFGGTKDPEVADRMGKICALIPCPGIDLAAAERLAEVAVEEGSNHVYLAYFEFGKGLAEYRTGHFGNAADLMVKVLAAEGVPDRGAQADAVLAMAESKLGHPDRAKSALLNGKAIFSQLPGPQGGDLGKDWFEWIITHTLLEEADSLAHGTSN